MRSSVLLLAAACWLLTPAGADEDNLSGGALCIHHEPAIVYSSDPPADGWCAAYEGHAISGPDELIARVDGPGEFVWYVLAAWSEPKRWCGVQFGFDFYDAGCWSFLDGEPCFPDQGLELPSAVWPGPGEGTALVTTTAPWQGNFVPVYMCSGYAYGLEPRGSTLIQIVESDPGPLCGFSNCANPRQLFPVPPNQGDEVRRGALGINMDGLGLPPLPILAVCCIPPECILSGDMDCADLGGDWFPEMDSCDPDPCKVAVCCTGTECSLATELDCLSGGGDTWHETLASCTPNPCLTYVCCIPGQECRDFVEDECLAIGGATWHEGYKCFDIGEACNSLAACCLNPPESPSCRLMWQQECLDHHPELMEFVPGDLWHPSHSDCGVTNPCVTPVLERTWGRIKRMYQ